MNPSVVRWFHIATENFASFNVPLVNLGCLQHADEDITWTMSKLSV